MLKLKISNIQVVIAVLGVAFGIEAMRRRSDEFGSLADYHASRIQSVHDSNYPDPNWEATWLTGKSSLSPSEIAAFDRFKTVQIRYHEALYKKYRYARMRPWMWMFPDPWPPR